MCMLLRKCQMWLILCKSVDTWYQISTFLYISLFLIVFSFTILEWNTNMEEPPPRTSARLKEKNALSVVADDHKLKKKRLLKPVGTTDKGWRMTLSPMLILGRVNIRVKNFMNNLSEEKRAEYKKKMCERVWRHRAKKKAEGTLKPPKPATRAGMEK